MKLIFLYGPPAVGKLTIAQMLEQKTGYKLLHNHLLQNPIAEIFPFENPANSLLVREFRLRIFEEAAESNINLIATFGVAGNDPFNHIAEIRGNITAHNGDIYLVHLTADKETLLNRVENQSRKNHGKQLSKVKLAKMLQENLNMFAAYSKEKHLTINTAELSPEESVDLILENMYS